MNLACFPRAISGQHQRHWRRRRSKARRPGLSRQSARIPNTFNRLYPRRIRRSQTGNVRGQRRIIFAMWHGMVANHVHHWRVRPARIVDIRPAIQIARPQMQKRHRRPARNPRKTIRRARRNAFKQAQHRANTRLTIQRRHKMHLRGSRIGKTRRHTAICKR